MKMNVPHSTLLMNRRRFLPLLVAPVIVAIPAVRRLRGADAEGVRYSVTDLGVLSGGDYSIGYGINEHGVVAGMSTAPNDATRAVALQDKKLRDLGQDGETSSANDINTAGDVAGFVNTADGSRATLWKGDQRIDLGTLGGATSVAYGISDQGWVVGSSGMTIDDREVMRAFVWKDGAMSDLGTLGGDFAFAQAVNDTGWTVGAATTEPGKQLYEAGTLAVVWKDMLATKIPSIGGDISAALGVNANGWVVGGATTAPGLEYGGIGTHAFLWKENELYDLGTPSGSDMSVANDVNLAGEAVGFGGVAEPEDPNNAQQAILWEVDGTLVLLNDAISDDDWNLLTAFAINDEGQIAGLGLKNGEFRGFLLKKK
jgi:probable HAF family extracellular repeat protein